MRLRDFITVLAICPLTWLGLGRASIEGEMRPSRQDHVRLLDKLYSHRALQDRLSPGTLDSIVNLTVSLIPNTIFGIDEETQTMDTYMTLTVQWQDRDLTWNTSDYGGIEYVSLPLDKIWYPKFAIMNPAHIDYQGPNPPLGIVLTSQGNVSFMSGGFFRTTCNLDFTDYPMDYQKCHVPLALSNGDINCQISSAMLSERPKDVDFWQFMGEWEVINSSVFIAHVRHIPIVKCDLVLKRRRLFYTTCVLIPMFVTASLTTLAFLIPSSSGEKMSFMVSLFLANALTLSFVGNMMPKNINSWPKLITFMTGNLIASAIAIMLTVFVLQRYSKEQHEERSTKDEAFVHDDANINTGSHFDQQGSYNTQVTKGSSQSQTSFQQRLSASIPKSSKMSEERKKSFRNILSNIKSDTWDKLFFVISVVIMTFFSVWCWIN